MANKNEKLLEDKINYIENILSEPQMISEREISEILNHYYYNEALNGLIGRCDIAAQVEKSIKNISFLTNVKKKEHNSKKYYESKV